MWITSYANSDLGRRRKNNEDYFLVDENVGVYLVCDGVGGHEHGEVASSEAANTAVQHLRDNKAVIEGFEDTPEGREAIRSLVRDAVQAAGRWVWELASGASGRDRMGTTMTCLVVVGDKGVMGHVGDSRLYLGRGEEVHQLSEDHTYLWELIKRGELKPEDAKGHPFGNVVTRVLGQHEWVQVDTLIFDILPGDSYLLCSDGLSGYYDDPKELAQLLAGDDLEIVGPELIRIANERGGKDNITAVIARAEVREEDASFELDRTDEITLQFNTLKYVGLFQYLNHKELMQVQHVGETFSFPVGETVIEEGSPGDSIYIVLDGRLAVHRAGQHVTDLETGTHFGEMALLNARPRSASVVASTPARLMVISRDRFNDLVRREPTLGVKLLWSFAQVLSLRLDQTTDALYGNAPALTDSLAPPVR